MARVCPLDPRRGDTDRSHSIASADTVTMAGVRQGGRHDTRNRQEVVDHGRRRHGHAGIRGDSGHGRRPGKLGRRSVPRADREHAPAHERRREGGQLFVVEVYGRDATTVSDTAAANNRRLYGVDTPAQVIDKYKPGGVIYFTTRGPDNFGTPTQIATLSNGLQTAATDQPAGIPCSSRPTRRAAPSSPGSALRRRRCPGRCPSARAARRSTRTARPR